MSNRPRCFVSIPFGTKVSWRGASYDFDRIYSEGIRPAALMAGADCVRTDLELDDRKRPTIPGTALRDWSRIRDVRVVSARGRRRVEVESYLAVVTDCQRSGRSSSIRLWGQPPASLLRTSVR
jgi:hypothetical protein